MTMYWLRVFALVLCVCLTMGIDRLELYPFGAVHYDEQLEVGDDTSSAEFAVNTPIAFYDDIHDSLFVNSNGLITFETELPSYKSDLILPLDYKVIAPFLADVDISLSGQVYYRETSDPTLLNKARQDIVRSFPDFRLFDPSSLVIVTWDAVGYYNRRIDKVNTFQVVIASDSSDSFVMFLYPSDGIQWIKGEGKDSTADPPAQAGFDSGDRSRHFSLPGSGQQSVRQLASQSNIGISGVWLYRIGDLRDDNIESPEIHDVQSRPNPRPGDVQTCADAGQRACVGNSRCKDYMSGYCCECIPPSIGNGQICIKSDEPQRVSGKVSGTVNGVQIDGVDLHAYIVTTDGRTYTAISRIPQAIGHSMKAVYTIGSVMGFLFAVPQQPNSKNGFMITGGQFNRTAIMQFSSPGRESLTIRQTLSGQDVQGHMRMVTYLDGTIPRLPEPRGAQSGRSSEEEKVILDDYKEEYSRTAPGTIKSFSTHTFRTNGVQYRFTLDQTLSFTECSAKPLTDLGVIRLSVSRNFLAYNTDNDQIVRFSQTNKVTPAGGEGNDELCRDARCDSNADCIPSRNTVQCVCRTGYQGSGQQCRDVNECGDHTDSCHASAQCYNTDGSYECRCRPGFTGDGRNCIKDSVPTESCNILRNCDSNAQCLYDQRTRTYSCQCNPGYVGDGRSCESDTGGEPDDEDCNIPNFCDVNARCSYDSETRRSSCRCNPGYDGNGRECTRADCRRNPGVCDRNARCERQNLEFVCQCSQGFRGDGYQSCVAAGDRPSYLLYTQGMYIMETPFTPSNENRGKHVLYIPGQTAVGIDVDCSTRYFYWTDVAGKAISKARLDGTDSDTVLRNLGSPEGVAVDWLSKNLYWTDSGIDRIEVSRLDGTNRKTLFHDNLVNPRAIAVDPLRGLLFWTDWNRDSPKIEKANMDGTERQALVTEGLGLPNGLTLDYDSSQVCWADAGTHAVECVSYDGRGRRVMKQDAGYPFGLVYANNLFYWTDWERKTLPNINKNSDRANVDLTLPPGANGRLYDIAAVRSPCPSGSNSCAYNNGGCRFLCLPTSKGGRTCTCPDDIDPEECNRIALL